MSNKVILSDNDKQVLTQLFNDVQRSNEYHNNLEFWTERLGSEKASRYYLFGSTIERVLYSMISRYNATLHTHIKEHIADCIDSSIYYGVAIGGVYKKEPVLRSNYRDVYAAYIRYLRTVFSVDDIK